MKGTLAFAGRGGHGKARRLPLFDKLLVQIQTTDIKCQFRSQHLEEAQNVICGLGERIGNKVQTSVFQVRQGLRAVFIARMRGERSKPASFAQRFALPNSALCHGVYGEQN